jgi:hypothetical protein
MNIQLGDLVVFKKGLYRDEENTIYRVIEINGDRVMIELVNTNMTIKPQSIAFLSELEKQ